MEFFYLVLKFKYNYMLMIPFYIFMHSWKFIHEIGIGWRINGLYVRGGLYPRSLNGWLDAFCT